MNAILDVRNLEKTFALHRRNGAILSVLKNFNCALTPGECVALDGPSGVGKSTVMKCVYGNYRADDGEIRVTWDGNIVDVANAEPRHILHLRRHVIGYVSQFLRVVPRVPAIDIVCEPLRLTGVEPDAAYERARTILDRLKIPHQLWSLPPATFSGGEQQRINIARGLVSTFPLLLLDEPTASLDAENRVPVIDLIRDAIENGSAVVCVSHDPELRDRVVTRTIQIPALAMRPE